MINYTISSNNVHITDSYKVSKTYMPIVIKELKNEYPDNLVLKNRKKISLIFEWSVHNFLYNLHIARSHTKDVDLEYPQKWYYKLGYNIFGPISWLFIL